MTATDDFELVKMALTYAARPETLSDEGFRLALDALARLRAAAVVSVDRGDA